MTALATLGALVLSVITACSDGDEQRDGAIEVVGAWDGEEQTSFQRVLDRFNNDTGSDVRYTSLGDGIAGELKKRIDAGRAPDVAILPQPGLLADLARRGLLQPVEDVAGSLVDRNYAGTWRRLASVSGNLYGVWFKVANKSVVWYRTQAFSEARTAEPRNWQELLSVNNALASAGITPLALGAGSEWPLTDWFENVYLRTAGPQRYDQLACHQIRWTDDSVKQALAMLGQVLGQHDWIAGGIVGSSATTFDQSIQQVFGNPPAAAMVSGSDFVGTLVRAAGVEPGVDAKFFDFPAIGGSDGLVVGGDVAVLMKDSKVGRDFVRYLATPEAAEPWARAGGFISPNRTLDLAVYPDQSSFLLANSVREAGDTFRYDLSDLLPASFGGTPGRGMLRILKDYLRDPQNTQSITDRLEEVALVAETGCT